MAAVGATGVWLLAPSVAWFDSGELAAAAAQLGVPHPTGFPGYCLAGHTLARLPLASSALRVHLLGVVCATAAMALWLYAAQLPLRTAGSRFAATLTICVLPWGVPALAMHLRSAEVYPPVWLTAAAAVWAHACLTAPQRLWVLAALAGVGAGLHVEAVLLPALLWLVAAAACYRLPRPLLGKPLLGSLALALLVALAAVAYLPLAAYRQPLLQWGDPASLSGLWDHLTAASIRQAFGDRIGGDRSGGAALGHLVWLNGKWLLAPAALGLAAAWHPQRRWAAATLVVVIADAVYSALINPMGLRDNQAGLVALCGLCALAGRGLLALPVAFGPRAAVVPAVVAVMAIAFAVTGLSNQPACGQTDLAVGGRWADRLLQRAAPAQVLVTASDHGGSACAWLQTGENVRPDVACVPGVFLRQDRQLLQLARSRQRPQWLAAAGQPQSARRLQQWLQPEMRSAAVGWQPGLAAEDSWIAGAEVPGLPWAQLALPGPTAERARQVAANLPAAATTLCALLDAGAQCAQAPTLSAALSAELAVYAASWARRDPLVALALARAAVGMHASAKALHNLAILLLPVDPAGALQLALRALTTEPDYVRAHRVAARACLATGDLVAAADHARQAARAIADPAERALWLQTLAAEAQPALRSVFAAMLGL